MSKREQNISGKDMSMALFVIGDPHLSLATGKSMNIFGGWTDYEMRLEKNWRRVVSEDDTVVVAGDISWCMNLEEGLKDFQFLDSLPGRKIILKGNHDYWWATKKKADEFFEKYSLNTLNILHNNTYTAGDFAICGTRGWFFDAESDADKKVVLREAGRLRASIKAAKETGLEPVVFLHYPPANLTQKCDEIYDVLIEEGITRCYYGHLHSYSHNGALNGMSDGIRFSLISSDFLEFCPALVY
jgi:predicted phosphohydrolase